MHLKTDNLLSNGLGLKRWFSEVIFAIPQQIHQISYILVVTFFCGNQEVSFGFEAKCQPDALWLLFQLKNVLTKYYKRCVRED